MSDALARLGTHEYNRQLFERTWTLASIIEPDRWPTWPMYSELAACSPMRLEVGPGCHPKLPLEGTHVVDLAEPPLAALARRGAIPHRGLLHEVAFAEGTFDLVLLIEVLEHIDDDRAMLREIHRIVRPGGTFVIDVPLHMKYYSAFDRLVGHVRRYDPLDLRQKLQEAGFEPVRWEGRHLMYGRFVMWLMALFVRLFPRLSIRLNEKNGPELRKKLGIQWMETDYEGVAGRASDISIICRRR